MLLAVASALLLVALVTGAGGFLGSLVAFGLWLAIVHRSRSVSSVVSAPASPSSRRLALGLIAIGVAVTLILRWPIAFHDVVHYAGPDEGELVENMLEMIRMGDWDHRHPGYPGLHFYLQMLPAKAHLAASGRTIPELPRAGFYLRARLMTLVAGALAAGWVLWIGRDSMSLPSASLAGGLMALSPLAFRESAVVNPDLMLMLFVSASLLASLRVLERSESGAWALYCLAGASVGLAAAIKYTGVFTLAPFCLAWLLGRHPRRDAWPWLFGLASSGAAFVLASPYTLLNASAFVHGLSMHVGYYQAAQINAPLELTRQVATRGVGVVAALAALGAAARGLCVVDKRLLVLLAYPLSYWFVFSLFDRAYPRHALVLLPATALLAADAFERVSRRVPMWVRVAVALAFVAGPFLESLELRRRARRQTPAEAAAAWVESNLPAGSRVLEDQNTPRLDPERYRVHRIGVEEKRFVGNFDWVLISGYPPGLSSRGLREVARFDNDDAIGDRIVAYQVPERESLMPRTFRGGRKTARVGAGDLANFGDGWYAPTPGAFETSRLSQGASSEIFFILDEVSDLNAELTIGAAVDAGKLTLKLNGEELGELSYARERDSYDWRLPEVTLTPGLNQLVLEYGELTRLDRRHPDTAIRLYRLNLEQR